MSIEVIGVAVGILGIIVGVILWIVGGPGLLPRTVIGLGIIVALLALLWWVITRDDSPPPPINGEASGVGCFEKPGSHGD